MKRKHQRRLALLAATAAPAVLVAWCVVQRKAIIVRWHILRLRSGSPEVRAEAIDALERHGSMVAVPALVAVARDRKPRGRGPSGLSRSCSRMPRPKTRSKWPNDRLARM